MYSVSTNFMINARKWNVLFLELSEVILATLELTIIILYPQYYSLYILYNRNDPRKGRKYHTKTRENTRVRLPQWSKAVKCISRFSASLAFSREHQYGMHIQGCKCRFRVCSIYANQKGDSSVNRVVLTIYWYDVYRIDAILRAWWYRIYAFSIG